MNVRLVFFAAPVALFISLVAACSSSHDGPPRRDPVDASTDAEVPDDATTPSDAGQAPADAGQAPVDAGQAPDGSLECVPLGEPCTEPTDCCGYHPPSCTDGIFQCEGTCAKVILPC